MTLMNSQSEGKAKGEQGSSMDSVSSDCLLKVSSNREQRERKEPAISSKHLHAITLCLLICKTELTFDSTNLA
jgi:hypothetical protein